MIITVGGTIIRVSCDEISKIGRDTQGVRVMKTNDSIVSNIAITPKSENDEEVEGEETAEPVESTETPAE